MSYIFDPDTLHGIVREVIGQPLPEMIEGIRGALKERYPGHILDGHHWIFNNAGGAMGQMLVLHASITEYVMIFGSPIGTEGHSGRFYAKDFFFILEGEQWAYAEGDLEKRVYRPGDLHVLEPGTGEGYKMPEACFALEYARGVIPAMLPFGFADGLSSTLDVSALARTVGVYTKAVVGNLVRGEGLSVMDPATITAHLLDHVPFHVSIGVTLFIDAVLLGLLSWAYRSPRFEKYLLRKPMPMKVTQANYRWTVATTGLLSTLSTVGLVYGLAPFTVSTAPAAWWVIALQGLGVMFVYDFAYYFLHRFLHIKALMPLVHGVHHRVRFPSALESLYLSPIEMLAGLGLLMVVTMVIGPIHWVAFAAVFFVYSTLHIVIHSGMKFPYPGFGVINYLTLKHHKHHLNKHGHNYASVTPLPDIVFRTSI